MSNIYGFNPKSTLLVPTLIKDAIKKRLMKIFINKNCSKDFLSIEDTFSLVMKIIHKGKDKVYNVASGKNISLDKIAKKISFLTNCKILYLNQKKIIKEPIINISKIKKEFKFVPSSNLILDLPKIIKRYSL